MSSVAYKFLKWCLILNTKFYKSHDSQKNAIFNFFNFVINYFVSTFGRNDDFGSKKGSVSSNLWKFSRPIVNVFKILGAFHLNFDLLIKGSVEIFLYHVKIYSLILTNSKLFDRVSVGIPLD